MRQQIIVKDLPCVMTAAEKALKSDQLVAVLGTINDLEEEKKAATAELGAKLKSEKKRGGFLAHEVRTGKEVRPIECVERNRYEDDLVDLIRNDTGEVVQTRAMDPRDRQAHMDLGRTDEAREKKRGKGRKGELRDVIAAPPELEQPTPDDEPTDGMH